MKPKKFRSFSDYIGHSIEKYKVLELLERGAFGEVYICEHEDSLKRYAMKVPFSSKHNSKHWKYLAEFTFQREVFILQQFLKYETQWSLRHHGLPVIQDVLNVTIFPYSQQKPEKKVEEEEVSSSSEEKKRTKLNEQLPLVLSVIIIDLLGPSLSDIFWSRNLKPFPFSTVCKIAIQLLKTFQFIHRHGLVHSDIKPSNLLVGGLKWRKIYVIDFGMTENYLSKDGEHVKVGKGKGFLGTTLYSGTNAMEGNMPSRKDDMQSIGYVLHFLATGRINWRKECELMKQKPTSRSSSAKHMKKSSTSTTGGTTSQSSTLINKEELKLQVLEKKNKFPKFLRHETPCLPVIIKYFEIIERMKYPSKPPYTKLRSLFENYLAAKRPKKWIKELYDISWIHVDQKEKKKKDEEENEGESDENEEDSDSEEKEEEQDEVKDEQMKLFMEFKNRGRSKELDSSSVLFGAQLQLPNQMPFFVI